MFGDFERDDEVERLRDRQWLGKVGSDEGFWRNAQPVERDPGAVEPRDPLDATIAEDGEPGAGAAADIDDAAGPDDIHQQGHDELSRAVGVRCDIRVICVVVARHGDSFRRLRGWWVECNRSVYEPAVGGTG